MFQTSSIPTTTFSSCASGRMRSLIDLLRARPGVLVGGLGVDDGGHQQHGRRPTASRCAATPPSRRRSCVTTSGSALESGYFQWSAFITEWIVRPGLRGGLLDLVGDCGVGDRPDLDALEARRRAPAGTLAVGRAPWAASTRRRPSSSRPPRPRAAAGAPPRRRARWPTPGTPAGRSSSCRSPLSRGDYSAGRIARPGSRSVCIAAPADWPVPGLESVRGSLERARASAPGPYKRRRSP